MSKGHRGVLTKQLVQTRAEGEMVIVTIGNSELKFHYTDGLQLSQWIRMSCKEAKRNAGDMSRHWSVIAQLDDANAR